MSRFVSISINRLPLRWKFGTNGSIFVNGLVEMTRLILLLGLLAFACPSLIAQPGKGNGGDTAKTEVKTKKNKKNKLTETREEKQARKHAEKIEKSKRTGKAMISRDTLYCNGAPVCYAKEVYKNLLGNVTTYSVRGFNSSSEDIHISLENVSSGSQTVYYWVWVHKDARFETEQKEDPMAMICYYKVYKDTQFNEKNFSILQVSNTKNISGYNGKPAPKSGDTEKANRNVADKVVFTGRDIRQSSVLIGHIEMTTNSQSGSIITTYTIYNAEGNLVATAKNHGMTDHQWDLVTANDNRQHQVSSSLLHDQEDIVVFLIKLLYL